MSPFEIINFITNIAEQSKKMRIFKRHSVHHHHHHGFGQNPV